jgi:hypothetical protein
MKEKILNFIKDKKNKALFLTSIIALIFIPVFLFTIAVFTQNNNKNQAITPTTNPTSILNTSTTPLPSKPSFSFTPPPTYPPVNPTGYTAHKQFSIISTSPANNQTNIPINLNAIIITFDQPVTVQDIPLSIGPSIQYTIAAQNNSIIITPQEQLKTGMTYDIVLRLYQNEGQIKLYPFNFTIAGPTPTPLPTDQPGWENPDELRLTAPDVYLSNYTPYSETSFNVTSDYIFTPTGHFYFVATLHGDTTSAKNAFITWLHSLKLTDQQIQGLDIRYQ